MRNAIPAAATAEETDPRQAFQNLLDKLVIGMSVLGLPAVLIALARAAEFGWRWGLSVQVASWGGVVGLLLLRPRLSFRQRTYGFMALLMLYATAGVMTWGLSAQGFLLLFGGVLMATMVDGPRAGLLATLFAVGAGTAAALGFVNGWLTMGVDTHAYNRSALGWATGVSTAAVVMLAAVWSLGRLKSSWLGIIQILREREEEYASILRFTPDIIYRLDVDHRITYISEAVRRYGYEPEDLWGRSLLDFVHPQERPVVARRLQERRTGERRTHNMEVHLFQPPPSSPASASDESHPFSHPVFLISAEGLYESGQAQAPFHQGTQGVARDITEYKSMYRELLREKIFSEITINSLPGIFYLFTESAHLAQWNHTLASVSGYAPEELRNRHILDFFPDEEHAVVGERFREALAQGTSRVEAHLLSKSGTATPYLFTGSVLALDGQRFVVGMGIDITERIQAEATLAESEKQYRFLAENIEDIIWSLDLELGLTYISPAVEKILGWTPEEVRSQGLESIMPEETLATFRRMAARGGAQGGTRREVARVVTLEQTFTHRQGHTVWVEMTVTVLCGAQGAPYGLLGVARDITARRQARQEKEELQQKLERARKMEALGLLAGGVAHDLNNILSGIVSYPSLMMMKLPPESPLRGNLAKMKASGEKASEIVQDLLTLARRGVKAKEVLDINQVIREHLKSAEYLHLRSRHHGVRVMTELAPDLLFIEGSPVHLKKALMNLISNAFEAQPDGGTVTIQTRNRYIDRPLKGYDDIEKGEFVRLRIVDQGGGMTPEEVERIFEPFYTRKAMERSGTGLGMAVVWGTVQDHQGYIHVKSAPDKGARFDLYFPVTRRPAAQVQDAPDLKDLRGGAQTVLVVDDDREQREVAVDILESLNYRAEAVDSGAAALDRLAGQAMDLLVLDMVMPGGMDGLETYRAVLERHPGQKALVVSGFAKTDRVQETLRLGAAGFVRKPYTVERLALALKEALDDSGRS
jgi:PAS domain S-box-containing protein